MNVMISKTGFNILTGGGFFLFSSFCLFAQESTTAETQSMQPRVINVSESAEDTPTIKKVTALGEVVINTALGFKKTAKSLSYSAQAIKPDELTNVKDANFTNAMTGKASNVTISQGSGGVGAANKIILRGNNSITGTGQPLIVVDGMPVTNSNPRVDPGESGGFGGTNLSADGLSSINPEDIESFTILKGPSAAALYGSQAANGAILITTKSGKAGVTRIDVSTNNTFSIPAYYPKSQTTYGGVDNQGNGSWGAKITDGSGVGVAGLLKQFYQTQVLTSNTVSLSAGNEKARVYTSYANTYGKGLIPNNSLLRHNFDIKGDMNLFKNFLEIGAKVSYMQQNQRNPFSPGQYSNPLYSMNQLSANFPLSQYKNYASPTGFGALPGIDGQNWSTQPTEGFQNPYWIAHKMIADDKQDRLLTSANIKMNFTDYLNLQVRGTLDRMTDNYTNKKYVGTAKTLAGTNGHMQISNANTTQWYGDVLLNFNKDIVKDIFHINALLGGSIRDYSNTGSFADAKQLMFFPNYFDISNFNFQQGAFTQTIKEYDRKQMQSVFYSAEFSYKDALFLTHTGRNDWSSTLPSNKNNYFYPSIGGSAVLTELIKGMQSRTLNYLKVRVSYTQVGNDLPSFIINPIFTVTSTGGAQQATTIVKPGVTIKPELTSSIEAGIDFAMFNNILRFEGTYYKTNTTNQLFTIPAPQSTGYNFFYVNGGDIQNQGYELSLSVSPSFGKVNWVSTINFSQNFNKIISLSNETPIIYLTDQASFKSVIKEGGKVGDMYARKLIPNSNVGGLPEVNPSNELEYVGNPNPKALLSWGNSFSYKGFRLSFLIDARIGGKILSLTQFGLDASGNSIQSAIDRDRGYAEAYGTQYPANQITGTTGGIRQYYTNLTNTNSGAWGEYVYDATVIRLRELSLAYSLPPSLLEKTKVIKAISLAFIARNLFYFYKPAPVDAEVTSTTNSNLFMGVEMYNLPALRSFGFSVNFTF